jgi:hypothetical protein
MFFADDLNAVSHGIQLAVAPVFLLTAVAAVIGTVAGRLARIIDRARILEERIDAAPESDPMSVAFGELRALRVRGALVNVCIAMLTFSGIMIGLTIMALFLGETAELQTFRIVTILFLSGVAFFLVALLLFLAETLLATRILKFGHRSASRRRGS